MSFLNSYDIYKGVKEKMNSPYDGDFKVTQIQHSQHDGLDIVGLDSKEIHATISGAVQYAGWENPNDHLQGFGQYVCIRGIDGYFYYYGHMSEIKVKTGQTVKITDVIGIEGSTGHSTGSHCHYCIRKNFAKGNELSTPLLSGIPNALGIYNDGHKPKANAKEEIIITLGGKKYKITEV